MKRLQQHLACMRMLCDTCYILDPEIRESPKVEEAVSVLNDLFASDPSRKVVVFSEWVKMLELMEERLEAEGIGFTVHTGAVRQDRRREELKRFKTDPACRVLLSSESGGVGLNLQAASVIMNLDLPWNPAKLEQHIARAWRKHQTRDVLVVNLVSELTIEHAMIATLKFKQGLADAVLDARGDLADFEKPSARKAFLARVNELMAQQLPAVVSADGTKGRTAEGTAQNGEPAESPSADAGTAARTEASGAEDVAREKEQALAAVDPKVLLQLDPDAVLTLQLSAQDLPLPDCVARANRFLEECSLMM